MILKSIAAVFIASTIINGGAIQAHASTRHQGSEKSRQILLKYSASQTLCQSMDVFLNIIKINYPNRYYLTPYTETGGDDLARYIGQMKNYSNLTIVNKYKEYQAWSSHWPIKFYLIPEGAFRKDILVSWNIPYDNGSAYQSRIYIIKPRIAFSLVTLNPDSREIKTVLPGIMPKGVIAPDPGSIDLQLNFETPQPEFQRAPFVSQSLPPHGISFRAGRVPAKPLAQAIRGGLDYSQNSQTAFVYRNNLYFLAGNPLQSQAILYSVSQDLNAEVQYFFSIRKNLQDLESLTATQIH